MAFHCCFSNQLEVLASRFVDRLTASRNRADLFTPVRVVLPTGGLEAYLRYFVAADPRSGIAANFDTPFLSSFMHRTLRSFAPEYELSFSRFTPESLLWQLERELNKNARLYPEVVGYLRGGDGGDRDLRRIQLSRTLASCFDEYLMYRPDLPALWRGNRRAYAHDEMELLQMRLYQALLDETLSPDFWLDRFLTSPIAPGVVPESFSVFGVSTLPKRLLDFFVKCATVSEVDFYALSPCAAYWGDVRSRREHARIVRQSGEDDQAPGSRGNALLGAFGAAGRTFYETLLEFDGMEEVDFEEAYRHFVPVADASNPDGYGSSTLLRTMQQDILYNFERGEGADGQLRGHTLAFPATDDSITVHNCHSMQREVEVLHDVLLDLVEREGYQPRDLFVTAPDIAAYEPYIRAVFGGGPLKDFCSICDRSFRESGELIPAMLELFSLITGRFEAETMLDFLERPAVGRAFGIERADLAVLRQWADGTAIYWGVDAEMRREVCSVAFDEYSWRQGLDRLLGGFALHGGGEMEDLAPADGAEGDDALLLGRFGWYAETLFEWGRQLRKARSPRSWMEFFLRLIDEALSPEAQDYAELGALRNAAFSLFGGGDEYDIAFDAARDVFEHALDQPSRRDGFLRGRITFCSMMPMRNVPRRVVALLGLSDGAFPRREVRNSFRLTTRHPRSGDRSRAAEDRYLFLESLLSARDKLMIFYVGQSARTQETIPPAVPLGELLEFLSHAFRRGEQPFQEVRHALQGFDRAYFDRRHPDQFSYHQPNARVCAALGAIHAGTAAIEPEALFSRELAQKAEKPSMIDLEEWNRFFQNPCDYFLQSRLGFGKSAFHEKILSPSELTDTDSRLFRHQRYEAIGQGFLQDVPREKLLRRLQLKSMLPVGPSGERLFDEYYDTIRQTPQKWRHRMADRHPLPRSFKGSSLEVHGTVPLDASGSNQYFLRFATLRGQDFMAFYLNHLLGSLQQPLRSVLYDFDARCDRVLEAVPAAEAWNRLETLSDFFLSSLDRIPAFFVNTAFVTWSNGSFDSGRKAFESEWTYAPSIRYFFDRAALEDQELAGEFLHCTQRIFPPREELHDE